MCGQSGGKATNASSILATRIFTPCTCKGSKAPSGTSAAKHNRCQAKSQLRYPGWVGSRRVSDWIVRALVETAGVEHHVALQKARTMLAQDKSIVITANQEELGLTAVDMGIDA